MAKCSFCKSSIEPGTGKMYVQNDGRILHFCTSKCENNQLKLHRVARTLKWTKAWIKTKKETEEKKE